MENPYYYLFYVMAFFLRWLNKGYEDYAFRALAIVSVLMGTNVLSLAFLLIDIHYNQTQVNLICLMLTILIFGVNHRFLYKNGKAESIIKTFDSKYQGRRPKGWKLVGAVCYSVLSVALFAYLAYLGNLHQLTPVFGKGSA